ncbi:MAG: EAL domain-containing protein [Chloroflexi bacterium]|nr:EAL domain-containing protein [Chloroflexota bacterium]
MFNSWLPDSARRLTLSAHLFLCLGLMAALPTLLLGWVQTREWAGIQIEQGDYQNRLAAQALAREVGLIVDAHARAIEALAKQVEAQGTMDPAILQEMVERQRAAYNTFPLMYVANIQGRSIAASPTVDIQGNPSVGKDFSDRDYYIKLMATQDTAISKVQIGRTIGVPTIQIVAPIRDASGTMIGFSEGSLDLTLIQRLAEEITGKGIPPYSTVLDAEGQVIAYAGADPGSSGEVMRKLGDRPVYRSTANLTGELRNGLDEDGDRVRAIAAPIQARDLNWTVVVARQEAIYAAQIASSEHKTIFVALVAVLAGLVVAALLSKALAQPFAQLAAVATAVGNGDFSQPPVRIKNWHPRDVRSLIVTVSWMIEQQRTRTEHLEQRVAERTTELRAANVELDASLAHLQRARDEAEEAQQRYASLFEQNPDGVFSLNTNQRIISANPAFQRLFGYSLDEVIGGSLMPLIAVADRELVSEHLKLVAQGKPRDFQVNLVNHDGEQVAVTITALPMVIGGRIVGIYGIAKDISERKRAEEALEHQALHDALTGLPNRTLLNDRLERLIIAHRRNERGMALIVMDLDRFKDVNDTLGHQAGDALLQQVSGRLQSALRTSDTVARLGGDEFAILLPSVRIQGGIGVAQKILRALERPFTIGEQEITVAASLGITACPDHGDDSATLMRRADVAMYVAKRNNGGFAVYSPEHDQNNVDRLAIASELRRAIDNGELRLHYQPKVSFKTGQVIRVEALVRWQHPEQGLVPPDRFIPVAEQTGLIRPLGQWVLEEALSQYHTWRDNGLRVPIAVNLSMHNLQEPELPAQIGGMLARWGIPPSELVLEITETTLMADPIRTKDVLNRLRGLGIQISIDDFGVGHSTFSYLKHLPVNEIKIDRSFVQEMNLNESDAAIVRSTIDLAHSLGLAVVAEGIENEETWDRLSGMGCDVAQGYYLSRPLAPEAFSLWLEETNYGAMGDEHAA